MAIEARCPRCSSDLLIPQRSTGAGPGRLLVELRCAECSSWTDVELTRTELAELDRAHIAGRAELLCAYEKCVNESMEALAHCLGVAFAQDLLGPDDFAPRRAALS